MLRTWRVRTIVYSAAPPLGFQSADVDDIIGIASEGTWRAIGKVEQIVRDGDSPQAYVRTITLNAIRKAGRQRMRWGESRDPAQFEPLPAGSGHATVPESPDGVVVRLTLAAALRRLRYERRIIVFLRIYWGMRLTEIAEYLDLPYGTVTSNYQAGRDELRKMGV